MSEHKTKRPDPLKESTKRPRSLSSLVAAVGASAIGLLGMLPSASANTNSQRLVKLPLANRPSCPKPPEQS